MTIQKYVSSLLPAFSKSELEEDMQTLKKDLQENTLPPLQAAAEYFGRDGFQAKENQDFNRVFERQSIRDAEKDYVATMAKAAGRFLETLQKVDNTLDDFGRDVTQKGMTYRQVNVLRLLEMGNFFVRYSRTLLRLTYANEQEAAGRGIGEGIAQVEYTWLIENRNAFFRSLNVMMYPPKTVDDLLGKIPDMVVIPEEVNNVRETVGADKIDPFQVNLLPPKLNPVYHVRMAITEWQVSRYNAGKEERRHLEYRLLALKEGREGKEDAGLERQIEYTENRLKKLNYRLSKMEED